MAISDALEHLRSVLSQEDLEVALQIGEDTTLDIGEKITSAFTELPDCLLSVTDVKALLAARTSQSKLTEELDTLVEEGVLEVSDETQRPLDKPNTSLYRSASNDFKRLKILALEEELVVGQSRYQFSLDGRLIRSLARIERLDAFSGKGQQRNEIRAHIDRIATGMREGTPVPNPVLLVINESTTVELEEGDDADGLEAFTVIRAVEPFQEVENPVHSVDLVQRSRLVELEFPFRTAAFDPEKNAVLVDGQQRTAAVSLVSLTDVPVISLTVNAVVGDEDAAQETFQVANDTVKIAADLSLMLAAVRKHVPAGKREEKLKAEACRILAVEDAASPFYGIAKVPGASGKGRYIAFRSLYEVVGVFRSEVLPSTSDAKELAVVVSRSFAVIKGLWPHAWSEKPSESKLTHGAGLRAMATLMSKLAAAQKMVNGPDSLKEEETWTKIQQRVDVLQDAIAWTFDDAAKGSAAARRLYMQDIADVQNTPSDIKKLTELITKTWDQLDTQAVGGAKP